MVGRLSTYAKNRILNLRFQKNSKIKHIAQILLQEDNIKVSRESISTFLKKYIDTKSIHDKPRSGRNKKLTSEEIQLIGEVTRLNRDITAPKIKQYLNLNVSTHTILRASKLFEWNKQNPNSNEAKKAAALERQLNGEVKKRKSNRSSRKLSKSKEEETSLLTEQKEEDISSTSLNTIVQLDDSFSNLSQQNNNITTNTIVNLNLNLVSEKDILSIKNLSSSPMVFATKILLKIFNLNELFGHNVSGKTFSKNVKNKKALDEKRINYIKWLVENHFETNNKDNLWKLCRTAINKIILINEKKASKSNDQKIPNDNNNNNINEPSQEDEKGSKFENRITLQVNDDCMQMNKEDDDDKDDEYEETETIRKISPECLNEESKIKPKTRKAKSDVYEPPSKLRPKRSIRKEIDQTSQLQIKSTELVDNIEDDYYDLQLLSEKEIILIKNLYCSPMIFSTKIMSRIFTEEELDGHSLSGKAFQKNSKSKKPLDEKRISYIKWLVEKHFKSEDSVQVWKSCRKAMGRVLRNIEKKIETNQTEHLTRSKTNTFSKVNADDEYDSLEEENFLNASATTNNTNANNCDISFASYEMPEKHTVVVLIDDESMHRKMMLEQQEEEAEAAAALVQQEQAEMEEKDSKHKTYQSLTNILNTADSTI